MSRLDRTGGRPRRGRAAGHALPAEVLLAALLLVMASAPARGAWLPDGNAVCTKPGIQWEPRAVADGVGGLYVAFQDDSNPAAPRVYIQRMTSSGAPAAGWPINGNLVSSVSPTTQQMEPTLAPDGAGGVFVGWMEVLSDSHVRIQHFDGAGGVVAGWPAGGLEPGLAGDPVQQIELLADGAGGAFALWLRDGFPYGDDPVVQAQRVSSAGARLWGVAGVTITGSTQSVAWLPSVHRPVSDGAGGFLFAWLAPGLRVQRITLSGTVQAGWPADGVSACGAFALPDHPVIATDGGGGVFVAWNDRRDGEQDLYLNHIVGTAAPGVGWFTDGNLVAGDPLREEGNAAVVHDNAGGVIVLYDSDNGPASDILGRRFDAFGASQWGAAARPVGVAPDGQLGPLAAPDGGGAFVSWNSDSRPGGIDPWFQALRLDGARSYGLGGTGLSAAAGEQYPSAIVPSGDGAIVIFQDTRNAGDWDLYAQYLPRSANLDAITTPGGWSSPIVPRRTSDATFASAILPPVLPGNVDSTWVNWNAHVPGPGQLPVFDYKLALDAITVDSVDVGENNGSPALYVAINQPRLTVRGGRHCLEQVVDGGNHVPESNELDNSWLSQWVWSPLVTTRSVGLPRSVPPNPCNGVTPSADGFAFTRDASYAWVTALAPAHSGDDYDLHVYDDYAGSTSGFSNLRQLSQHGGNATDFVVGHYSGTPVTLYPAAVRFAIGGGARPFAMDQTDAQGRNAAAVGTFENQNLAALRVADVYEAYLTAGETVEFSLIRNSGSSDLSFEVFPGTAGQIHRRGLGTAATTSSEPFDGLSFTASATGWHPVVVFRTFGTDVMSAVTYSLYWSPGRAEAGPPAVTPRATELGPPRPNPMRAVTRLSWSLAAESPVRLEIFDVAGRRVRALVDDTRPAGRYDSTWDGTDDRGTPVASGVYLARFVTRTATEVRRINFMR